LVSFGPAMKPSSDIDMYSTTREVSMLIAFRPC
jgi:hypothetical protein